MIEGIPYVNIGAAKINNEKTVIQVLNLEMNKAVWPQG